MASHSVHYFIETVPTSSTGRQRVPAKPENDCIKFFTLPSASTTLPGFSIPKVWILFVFNAFSMRSQLLSLDSAVKLIVRIKTMKIGPPRVLGSQHWSGFSNLWITTVLESPPRSIGQQSKGEVGAQRSTNHIPQHFPTIKADEGIFWQFYYEWQIPIYLDICTRNRLCSTYSFWSRLPDTTSARTHTPWHRHFCIITFEDAYGGLPLFRNMYRKGDILEGQYYIGNNSLTKW